MCISNRKIRKVNGEKRRINVRVQSANAVSNAIPKKGKKPKFK
jgi:hypothetical protein